MTSSPPSLLIVKVLATNLPPALARQSAQRYGRELPLQRIEAGGSSPEIGFRLTRRGFPSLDARFTVRPLGGNVYEVQGAIEDGPTQSFSYCLPEPAPLLVPFAPKLAPKIATFLLDARERQLGRHLLRMSPDPQNAPNTQPAGPSR
jgi:hypothetical protein